jgi:hypothetical protein
MPVNMSYPKARDNIVYKFFEILRTDNATPKCVVPKDAIIVDLEVCQNVIASTAAATFDLGWAGATDTLIDGFTMSNSAMVGLQKVGAAADPGFGTKLTADRTILSTYVAGSSTAGGTGWVKIGYVVPGPGETLFD